MTNNELKAIEFLKAQIWKHDEIDESAKSYRYEHSLRVAAIGRKIAKEEGLNEEALALGCILHDVGTFDSIEKPIDHGRVSAKIARNFLKILGLPKDTVEEICYGIAIHVDDKSDFEYERTILSTSISDCDNIDRFDTYRIYDNLFHYKFREKTLVEQLEYIDKHIEKLNRYSKEKLSTQTATNMWVEKLQFQIKFFERLKSQLESGLM